MNESRILSLDYGRARIGLAISDPLKTIASPLVVIKHESMKKDALKIHENVVKYNITKVIIGITFRLDGSLSEIASEAKKLGKYLHNRFNVDVEFTDETMTTRDAYTSISEGGKKKKNRKQNIDMYAACKILQAYLDNLKELENEK
ncbi:Holliday junction resolvase RuvX [bacterium]